VGLLGAGAGNAVRIAYTQAIMRPGARPD